MKKVLSLILMGLLVVTLAACGDKTPEIPENILDCIEDPQAEGCQDLIPDPTDDRSAEEILADTILENWDGEMTHLTSLLDSMDFDDSMTVETEFSFSIIEDGETEYIHVVLTDTTVEGTEGMILHRIIDLDFDGEELYTEIIFEEVATGVRVYLNVAPLKLLLVENGDQEAVDFLNVVGATEDWLMFKFDDSLDNMVELEVIKDILVSAFFEEMGETFFYDLQAELDLELMIDPLVDYGINLGMFFDYLVDAEYADAETMLETIDYETLIFDLDAAYLVPELVLVLTEFKTELDLELFDTDGHILSLQALGTQAWLDTLTEAEVLILADVLVDMNSEPGDMDLSMVLTEYYAGTLDHYLIMMVLEDPDFAYELSMMTGLDEVAFTAAWDTLDYEAFYLEEIDAEDLFNAIYEGQTAFDLYIIELALTVPETASILAAFSGVVAELEVFMYVVDDITYAFDNLSMFEEFFTLDYYLDNDLVTAELEISEDFAVITTLTLEPLAYAYLFQDVIEETVLYLDGFQSFELPYIQFINCPVGETCEPLPDYQELLQELAALEEIQFTVEYDPSNADEMITKIDFTDFINHLATMDEEVTMAPVVDLSIQITVSEVGTVTIPTAVSDVNMIAEDFAKFSLAMLAFEALEDVGDYYMANSSEFTLDFGDTRQLDTFEGYVNLSLAFDMNMSYVTVGGSVIAPDYLIQLFWHDGTPVFTSPLGLAELVAVVGPGTGGPATNVMFQTYVDKVVDANFNMTKLLFVYIFDEANNYEEEQSPMQ